jgi:hypothetical protein
MMMNCPPQPQQIDETEFFDDSNSKNTPFEEPTLNIDNMDAGVARACYARFLMSIGHDDSPQLCQSCNEDITTEAHIKGVKYNPYCLKKHM